MRADLRRDLTIAIRQRDAVAVSALRTALAAIENAEAVHPTGADVAPRTGPSPVAGSVLGLGAGDVPRRDLTDEDVRRIVRGERAELLAAASVYERRGQAERAERLRAESRVLDRYL
jgi:uncharacterized protein YqeY